MRGNNRHINRKTDERVRVVSVTDRLYSITHVIKIRIWFLNIHCAIIKPDGSKPAYSCLEILLYLAVQSRR